VLIELAAEALIEADARTSDALPVFTRTVTLGGGLTAAIVKGESDGESDANFLVLHDADSNLLCTIGDTALAELAPRLPIASGYLFQLLATTSCVETGLPFLTPEPPRLGATDSGGRIAEAAQYYVGRLETANVADTCGGHLACAWALNFVVEAATGSPVGGGLSTTRMLDALRAGRGAQISEQATVRPGDLVISPTTGNKVGHAGVIGVEGTVFSNSSSHGEWRQNYALTTWRAHYVEALGLKMFFYRLS
jgi:hypothetical protein